MWLERSSIKTLYKDSLKDFYQTSNAKPYQKIFDTKKDPNKNTQRNFNQELKTSAYPRRIT